MADSLAAQPRLFGAEEEASLAARAQAGPRHLYEIGPGPYAMGAKCRCVHCGDERRERRRSRG